MLRTTLILIMLCVFIVSGCGEHSSQTGSLSFNLSWNKHQTMTKQLQATAGLDVCSEYSINVITAKIYDAKNALVNNENWPCSYHEGVITNIPVGTGLTLVLEGYVNSSVAWRAEVINISIEGGQRKDVGSVAMNFIGDDHTPPVVSSVYPANNEQSASVVSSIYLCFSEALAPSTVNNSNITIKAGSTLLPGILSYDAAVTTAIFTPQSPLAYSTVYSVSISSNIKDIAGNALVNNYNYNFTTQARPIPIAPYNVKADGADSKSVVSWSNVANATGYNLYWSLSPDVSVSTGEKISNVSSPYTHTGLSNGTSYFYIVTAVDSYSESNPSSVVSALPRIWTIENVHNGLFADNLPTDIALDTLNKAYISYIYNGNYVYSTNKGGSWFRSSFDNLSGYKFNKIVLDKYNGIHLLYADSLNNLKYRKTDTGSSSGWSSETILKQNVTSASVKIDDNNKLHISYISNSKLYYLTNTSGVWITQLVNDDNTNFSAIALDGNNKAHISYYGWSKYLKYSTNKSGAWISNVIDQSGTNGTFTSIVVDKTMTVHIGAGCDGELKYVTNKAGYWLTNTLDNNGNVGSYISMASDSNNKVHISYYNDTSGDLKYATNNSGIWKIITIDDGNVGGVMYNPNGQVGKYNSIAIDSNNKYHISYLGAMSTLKYATNK